MAETNNIIYYYNLKITKKRHIHNWDREERLKNRPFLLLIQEFETTIYEINCLML